MDLAPHSATNHRSKLHTWRAAFLVGAAVTLCASAALGQSFDGSWLVLDDEEVEGYMDITGGSASLRDNDDVEGPFVLTPGAMGFDFTIETGDRTLGLVSVGPNELLGLRVGHDKAVSLFRVGEVPTALQGTWEVARAATGGYQTSVMVLTATNATHALGEGPQTSLAQGLAGDELAVILTIGGGDEPTLLRFHPLPGGGYIMVRNGEDDYWVAYPPGSPPAFLSGTTSEDDVCHQAYEMLVRCFEDHCRYDAGDPMCTMWSSSPIAAPNECTPAQAEQARMFLAAGCETMFTPRPSGP